MDEDFRPDDDPSTLFDNLADPSTLLDERPENQSEKPQRSSGHLWGQLGLSENYYVNEEWVNKCLAFIKEQKGFDMKGLYAQSGDSDRVAAMKNDYVKQGMIFSIPPKEDAHNVAALLKAYFRDMRPALINTSVYSSLIAVADEPLASQLPHIESVLSTLPECNYRLLSLLCAHLYEVTTHSPTEMNSLELASVFAPILLLPSNFSNSEVILDFGAAAVIIQVLIQRHSTVFQFSSTKVDTNFFSTKYKAFRAQQKYQAQSLFSSYSSSNRKRVASALRDGKGVFLVKGKSDLSAHDINKKVMEFLQTGDKAKELSSSSSSSEEAFLRGTNQEPDPEEKEREEREKLEREDKEKRKKEEQERDREEERKQRIEKIQREREREEKEQAEKEKKEKWDQEQKERKETEREERARKELVDKAEKEELERKEREEKEEKEKAEQERQEREEHEKQQTERRERGTRKKSEKEEKQRKEREEKEKEEKEAREMAEKEAEERGARGEREKRKKKLKTAIETPESQKVTRPSETTTTEEMTRNRKSEKNVQELSRLGLAATPPTYTEPFIAHHENKNRESIPTSHRQIGNLVTSPKWSQSESDSDDETTALYAHKTVNTHPGARGKSGPNSGNSASAEKKSAPGSASFTVYNEEDSFSETSDGFLDWETVLVHFRAGWKVWIMSLLFVCASTSKSVAMALWLKKLLPSFTDPDDKPFELLSAYVVIFYGCMFFVVVSTIGAAMCWLAKSKPPLPNFMSNWKWYIAAGVTSGIGHVLVTMVGHMHKTPHTIDVLFQDTKYLWSIPLSILLLETKSRFQWVHGFTIFAFACMLGGVIFLMAPILYYDTTDFSGEPSEIAVRSVTYFIGSVALALSPIYIEKFFYNRKRLQAGRSGTFDAFILCLWISIFQFVTVFVLFWLDLVPFIGSAKGSISVFIATVDKESSCLFQLGFCPDSVWMGFMFVLSWFVELLLMIKLSQDSANYVQLLNAISTPLVISFWLAFPWWETMNPEAWLPSSLWQNTPRWGVIPSFFLFLLGAITFKLWEMRQNSLQRPFLAY